MPMIESGVRSARSTRRTATVTTSQPLSRSAARAVSASENLPVPVKRRERNSKLPIRRMSSVIAWVSRGSSATDEVDDLHLVAFSERGLGVASARHDLSVSLDRDEGVAEAEAVDQRADGDRVVDLSFGPVHYEAHGTRG